MTDAPTILSVTDEAGMRALGRRLGEAVGEDGLVMFLSGELGAGKTTLVRGFLTGLGHEGPVKSPTYTLVEPYELDGRVAYHLDLYRLSDPEELAYLGVRDLLTERALVLVEWPERAAEALPTPDLQVAMAYGDTGRRVTLTPRSPRAQAMLARARLVG